MSIAAARCRLGIFVAAAGCIPALAGAQQAPAGAAPVRDPIDQILREQREREREPVLRAPAVSAPAATEDLGDLTFPQQLAVAGPTFRVETIHVVGDQLLAAGKVEAVVGPFRGRLLGVEHIRLLVARMNRLLVRNGFVTSRAQVGGQSIADGELEIQLVAGRIEQILVDGRDLADASIAVRLALPLKVGQVLRLQDIEQGVDQINRVRGQQAEVQIQPGAQPAGSVVAFKVARGDKRQWTLMADNQGGQASGRIREHVLVEQGNGLGLMETLNLGLVTSKETNAVFANVSLPWGYNTFNASRSWSEYQSLVGDVALVWGASHSYSLAWNRLLARDQNSKTAVDLAASRRRSQRAINGARLTPQDQGNMRLGVSYLRRFDVEAGPATWAVDAGWVRGMPNWGNETAAPDLPKSAPHARFNKLEANTSLTLPVSRTWQWRGRLALQWSRVGLPSGDQMFVGGNSTVRAAQESALGGDRGFYVRNEAALTAWSAFHGRLRGEPYVFVDAARLQSLADGPWRSLGSGGAGLRFAWGAASGEALAGRVLHRPDFLTGSPWRASIQLAYSF